MVKNIFAPIDEDEKELIKTINNEELVPVGKETELIKKLQLAAKNTGKKDQRMNIRMSKTDMDRLKAKALQEGIPYQTLVSGILHKYVNGVAI